jgi:hypothetical protein
MIVAAEEGIVGCEMGGIGDVREVEREVAGVAELEGMAVAVEIEIVGYEVEEDTSWSGTEEHTE